MKREDLTALKLSEDQVEGVMKLQNADLDPLKSQVASLTQERDNFKGQVEDYGTQVKTLKKSLEGNEDAQNQIKSLQEQVKRTKADGEAQLTKSQKANAMGLALRDAGARDAKAILPFLDDEVIKLDDGKLTGLEEQVKTLKGDHDYLFTPDKPETKEPENTGSRVQIVTGGNPSGSNQPTDPFEAKMAKYE